MSIDRDVRAFLGEVYNDRIMNDWTVRLCRDVSHRLVRKRKRMNILKQIVILSDSNLLIVQHTCMRFFF